MLGSGGVRITRLRDGEGEPMHKLTEKTYVNADSTKVVPEGDPEAAYLLGLEGDEISLETAQRVGLVEKESAYAEQTVDELRSLAEERDVEIPSKAKKAEIVEALETADANAAASGTAQVESPGENVSTTTTVEV
jgi:hypothetical protein